MAYKLFGKELRGRFGFPSGVIATNSDSAKWMLKNIPQIGFLVGKSTTIKPNLGNSEDILSQPTKDTLWNAVGYTNPGIDETIFEFCELKAFLDDQRINGVFLLPQIGESDPESFAVCATKFDAIKSKIDGLELNISCPHASEGGIIIGSDPIMVYKVVKAVKKITGLPIFIKFNAGLENYIEVIKKSIEAGADGISGINTLGGINPELSKQMGGISGANIFPIAFEAVKQVREITKVPMIVMGGIRGAQQIRMFDQIDPNFFYGIGTALGGMDSEGIRAYFQLLENDLFDGLNRSQSLTLNKELMTYKPFIVKKVESLSDSLKRIQFYESLDINALPGQFVFLKVENKHSKPFSVANDQEGLELVVRKVGESTSHIFKLKKNSVVRIRGPYGKPFYMPKNSPVVYVGAGCGIAPIYHAATHHQGEKIFIIGARDVSELVYLDQFKSMGKVYCSTDNGSYGFKGFIHELMEKCMLDILINNLNFFNCGPESALKKVNEIEKKYTDLEKIFHLVERMTSCGIGICGKCTIPNGLRACIDGPVFTAKTFEPGSYKRDKTGKRIAL